MFNPKMGHLPSPLGMIIPLIYGDDDYSWLFMIILVMIDDHDIHDDNKWME